MAADAPAVVVSPHARPAREETCVSATVLVLDAGSAPGNNLIRSLRAGDPSLVIVGCNDSRFFLKKSTADRNCLLPVASEAYPAALRRIVKRERVDLLLPTNDNDVRAIAALRNRLGCRTFLPRTSVIERCQDKYALTAFLRRRGIPAPLTFPVTDASRIETLFRRFGPREQLWCRVRSGTGSYGAIPVKSAEQVRSWIAYWEQMRGVPSGSFTLSEYLPGRDFCVQCLWNNGTMVLAKMAERITYLHDGSPSGVSSTPALARTAYEWRIVKVCEQAIRALDAKACGVFFVDIKENENGRPCITEINAGRFATITNIHDLVGKHNMAATFVRLALGERVRIDRPSDFAEGYYLVRSVDTLPAVLHKRELFEGIDDSEA
jgi:carbamoyl-phosphate synthase large subunit